MQKPYQVRRFISVLGIVLCSSGAGAQTQLQNPKPEIRNPKETRSSKSETNGRACVGGFVAAETGSSPQPASAIRPAAAVASPRTALWHVYDGYGSTRLMLNETGGVVQTFAYSAHGTLVASSGPPRTVYLYAGEQFDPDLGLYFNRARYLHPESGRFWTEDTFEGSQSDPPSLHRYLYAHADPVNRVDPSGQAAEFSAVGQIGIASIQFTVQAAYFKTAAFATATALTDYFSRQELFLFHVTDATIVELANEYNQGAFRTPTSGDPMFFATTSTHLASLLLYGVGYPAAIYTGLFTKPTTAGIKAFADDLSIPYHALPERLKKPLNKPVVILTGKKNSITSRTWFNGGVDVEGVFYVPLVYSTFTTVAGETVGPQNYKLIPLP